MAAVTFAALLRRNARFRNLWAGQVVSELGNWFNLLAELDLARVMSGSPWATTALMVSHTAPFCIFGPIAGAVADRFERRTLMIAADLSRAATTLGFLFVTSPDLLPLAYACAAVSAALSAFFEAAKNASMPNIVESDELLAANSLMHATRFLQMTIGMLLGGLVAHAYGYRAAFAVNTASFIISAIFISRIPAHALVAARDSASIAKRSIGVLVSDLRDALHFIRGNRLVFAIVALNIGWAFGGGMNTLIADRFGEIEYAGQIELIKGSALLFAAAGFGLCLGMMLAQRIGPSIARRNQLGEFMGWSIVAAGLIFAVSGLTSSIWWMVCLWIVNRTVLSSEFAIQETILMNSLPDHMRGKVITVDRSLEIATLSMSTVLGGWLFTIVPARQVPIVAGVLMALPGAVWVWAVLRRRLVVPRELLTRAHSLDETQLCSGSDLQSQSLAEPEITFEPRFSNGD